ncbi:hypothetical protein [Kitasatospora sp. NPDC087314]|uniref:hypothetical protein n=1 Tax=Kitasatospora sp. NPDC087314 TaxID=3364068 RepID=UPI0037F15136
MRRRTRGTGPADLLSARARCRLSAPPTSRSESERIVTSGDYLTVDVPPGRYRVRSSRGEPDRSADYYLEHPLPLR